VKSVFYLIFLGHFTVTAQININQFLSAEIKEIEWQELERKQQFFQSNSFASPWLREVEIRARIRGGNLMTPDYRLRLGLINPGEIAANRNYKGTLGEQIVLSKQIKHNDVLLERYQVLLEHMYNSRKLDIINQQLIFYNKMKSVVSNLDAETQFEEWIELTEEETNLELEKEELQKNIAVLDYLIRQRHQFSSPIYWTGFELIRINQIRELLQFETDSLNLLSNKEASLQLKAARQQYAIEKAESRSNIGFLQAQYSERWGDNLNQRLGLQVGVTLPIFNKDKPKLDREKMELIEDELSIDRVSQEIAESFSISDIALQSLLRQTELIATKQQAYNKLVQNINYQTFDIDREKKTFEYGIYLEASQLNYYFQLLDYYIKTLHQQNRLISQPMVNYISAELSQFEMKWGDN